MDTIPILLCIWYIIIGINFAGKELDKAIEYDEDFSLYDYVLHIILWPIILLINTILINKNNDTED